MHLRGAREDAWKRAIAFYRKKNKPPSEAFVAFIEFGPEGVCSLWPDLLSVELGEPPYRFRLNDTLHMKLMTTLLLSFGLRSKKTQAFTLYIIQEQGSCST